MFALVDVNSFYASCETVFRPDLLGRPVVVLSNNDGCVIARNAEAKKLDIPMGAPFFKIRDQIQRNKVTVFSSNYTLYADMSQRVMSTLEALAPAIEIYSIDEAFLDVSGISSCMPLETFGHQVRQKIWQDTHLRVGVGIAQTKTLAKLANFAAKRWTKAAHVLDLSCPLRQRKLMALLPAAKVWGVGRQLSKKLEGLGINTALELADTPVALIRKHFGVVLERTVRELRGESCLELESLQPARQNILCSRSFGSRITEYQEMHEAICNYAVRAAEKLRGEERYCREISTFIRTSPHDPEHPYYTNAASYKLLSPTQDTRDIISAAIRCLDKIWRPGHRYMKGGIMLGDFFTQGVAQLNLFDEFQPKPHSEKLMAALDKLNEKSGSRIWFAGQGIKQEWSMKREMLSPAYTTSFKDLPKVGQRADNIDPPMPGQVRYYAP
ncbi:translesion error-prone DNA polymerase V subunit UmuC [Erwinia pyri]|uniref:Translesion error-prone DNA polymerase V subunit UmuC n=1 Tax=Erwinia pyri TaxID=3062598 RepID=A0AA50HLB4_9GAMM|nr:translesion error-prone DNA polymerase V subunit UmuC [Erwinia sp. DE2]WLS77287.1 translesion error-prone DNA polymerase V subunit UmuC [Erwinia sp. DE2]